MVLIYENRLVPPERRLLRWYQRVMLYGSLAFAGIPILIWTIRFIVYRWKVWRSKPKKIKTSWTARGYLATKKFDGISREKQGIPGSIDSFGMHFGNDQNGLFKKGFEMLILDEFSVWRVQRQRLERIPEEKETEDEEDDMSQKGSTKKDPLPPKIILCLVHRPKMEPGASAHKQLSAVVDKVQQLQGCPNFTGLVFPANILPDSVTNDFLRHCASLNVPLVLLSSPPYTDIHGLDFTLVDGIVFESACIHSDGERRDFFQAAELRQGLARCARQKETRPNFFTGFHDLWDVRPAPAVIRRAYKVAKFHGACLQIGPAKGLTQIEECVPVEMCLSAFDWLKRDDIQKVHKAWIEETKRIECENMESGGVSYLDLNALMPTIPGMEQAFELHPVEDDDDPSYYYPDLNPILPTDYVVDAPKRNDFCSTSSLNDALCSLGCFDLREEIMQEHFDAVLKAQEHLKEINMLHSITENQMHSFVKAYRRLLSFYSEQSSQAQTKPTNRSNVVQPLIDGLIQGKILVYQGIDTGFAVPDHEAHVWGVSRILHSKDDDKLFIYLSLRASDVNGTLLHCYLAHAGISREQRFNFEADLARALDPDTPFDALPPRILAELNASTHSELLTMLSQIQVTNSPKTKIMQKIEEVALDLLVRDTTRLHWRVLHSRNLLKEEISVFELLEVRLAWYKKYGARYLPRTGRLERLFEIVDAVVLDALYDVNRGIIEAISKSLIEAFTPQDPKLTKMDICADLFALMVFCAFRKYAFEEVYMEATDRCPLFHQQPDQAGVFAELWVLGSQCEIYFDIMPRVLGDVIYHRYRSYLRRNVPPPEAWNGKDLFTAYMKVENLALPETMAEPTKKGWRTKFKKLDTVENIKKYGYLSIFCVPAIVDVTLLTFVGRGLYLTAFMHNIETLMGTYALLAALLLCAGVTGWVGSGGGFYLFNFAFDSLNHFMVQRFVGGLMLSTLLSIFAFIAFGFEYGWYGATIFVAYLNFLSPYLNLLGILATMHRDRSPLASGRLVLGKCMTTLIIAPIVTTFYNGHDVAIYLPLLYFFLGTLLYAYRDLCVSWSTWLDKIVTIDDQKVLDWYVEEYQTGDQTTVPKDNEKARAALLSTARQLLYNRVKKELNRYILFNAKESKMVKDLADGYHESVWLLRKESNGGPIPEPYTPTWHVQLKVSLNTQRLFVRGLKEHSPFILFRYSKYDIGQNVGLFLIALLDRWVSIAMSANGYILNFYIEFRARYGIAFSLLYFLSGAVALDSHIQHCWVAVNEKVPKRLGAPKEVEITRHGEQARKRALYYTALYELAILLMFLFGGSTVLVWLFVDDPQQLILYFSYCYGYTCILYFQFNRVFTRDVRLYVWTLLGSALIGFIVGVILHTIVVFHYFRFNDIIALSTASTLASITSFCLADFSPQPKDENNAMEVVEKTNWKLYSQKFIGLQTSDTCVKPLSHMPHLEELCVVSYRPGDHLSDRIEKLLSDYGPLNGLAKGLPALGSYRQLSLERWKTGVTTLYLTTSAGIRALGAPHSMAVGIRRDLRLDVYAFVPAVSPSNILQDDVPLVGNILAEALLHETCEIVFSLSHADAALAETCLADEDHKLVSCRMKSQLENSDTRSLTRICERTNVEMLKHLTFNLPVDTEWPHLPEDVRELIVHRILNKTYYPTPDVVQWMMTVSKEPWRVVNDRYTLRVKQCLAIFRLASSLFRKEVQPQRFSYQSRAAFSLPDIPATEGLGLQQITRPSSKGFWAGLKRGWLTIYRSVYTFVKFLAISSSAGFDVGRELWYTLRITSFRSTILWVSLKFWKLSCKLKELGVHAFLLHHRPTIDKVLRVARYGIPRVLTTNTIVVNDLQKPMTGFLSKGSDGLLKIEIYNGVHTKPPEEKLKVGTGGYDNMQRLRTLTLGVGEDATTNTYEYPETAMRSAAPWAKSISVKGKTEKVFYDLNGRESHGVMHANDRDWYFEYLYSTAPKGSRNILKGRFTSMDARFPAVYSVYWCIIPSNEDSNVRKWKPYEKVTRVVYSLEGKTWDTTWIYGHKRHPNLSTIYLENGKVTFQDAPCKEAVSDELGFFKKPQKIGFEHEDLLYFHNPSKIGGGFAKRLGQTGSSLWPFKKSKTVYQIVPTTRLRTILWQQWATAGNLDAVSACYIDELILREEPLLRRYWKLRDAGHFRRANLYIRSKLGVIAASIEVVDDVSQNTFLAIKIGDLLTMGLAKDANHITLRPEDCIQDTHDRLSVTFLDTGCWPDAPGGVSNCRRDLVNGHTTIRNHVLAESANDYGVPRYQVERSVNSLKVLPLWGLDGKTPFHGLFDNLLDCQVEERMRRTDLEIDVKGTFIPILRTIILGARMISYTPADLIKFSNAFLNLNKYFEEKDYNKTWRSQDVLKAWQDEWLKHHEDPNIVSPQQFFDIERPSLSNFDEALELWICYFFVYSVKVPDIVPTVFQTTHHGVGSLYGMLLKLRRGVTWGIWDHAIMWRESCLNVSTAQCLLPIPVQNMLLGCMKLAAHLAYTHADVILPCTSVYNPEWEADLGTDQGRRASKKEFRRKIDPVTNGIGNMGSFQPVTECISKEPTTVMLSNVQFIKDVKNVVQAADVIINTFGFKNYHLTIYGAMDRTPAYTVETQQIISSRGLAGLVKLGGFGSPKTVLKEAWLFMNSSLSEGLPLAIGEAALSGIPIVATEVGATAQVLTDPDTQESYGEVVPPNDPIALARARISLLAMLGPWAKYTDDEVSPPPLPDTFTPHDVKWITKRMYDKADARRKLGLRLRDVVLRAFHGDRYLREHEQMYWAQSYRTRQKRDAALTALTIRQNKFGKTRSMVIDSHDEVGGMWDEPRWQDFDPGSSIWDRFKESVGGGGSRKESVASFMGAEKV